MIAVSFFKKGKYTPFPLRITPNVFFILILFI